ncbi:hypothetical protein [Mesorhizobium sp.]|uniref:hypothetical protein n=1 Tax=Mesorhizobium sp. TaxID=1871066 RepID=UPI000FE73320|nr:hypothetical protein [Mesorhizobium sp.]RWK73922.1 MAG: hypothetical protein EOR50_21410 [Mesorhizobium sp.]RWP77074.1 MAG: hypothetical protein EOR09_08490 [Mesorhizobium sp.]
MTVPWQRDERHFQEASPDPIGTSLRHEFGSEWSAIGFVGMWGRFAVGFIADRAGIRTALTIRFLAGVVVFVLPPQYDQPDGRSSPIWAGISHVSPFPASAVLRSRRVDNRL